MGAVAPPGLGRLGWPQPRMRRDRQRVFRVLGSTVPSQPPPASPSPPARALTSVSHICACKHLSLGCFSCRALPQGCTLPGPCLSCGHARLQDLAPVWVPGAGCAAAGGGCLMEQCGMRSCCFGATTVAWGWGPAMWGPVLHPGAGLVGQESIVTFRPVCFTGRSLCNQASLVCSQPQDMVALAPAVPRHGLCSLQALTALSRERGCLRPHFSTQAPVGGGWRHLGFLLLWSQEQPWLHPRPCKREQQPSSISSSSVLPAPEQDSA